MRNKEKRSTYPAIVLTLPFCLALPQYGGDPPREEPDLSQAVKNTARLRGYSFRIDERPGQGTGGTFQGRYAKGQPVYFLADRIEFYQKGDVLAYKDGGDWQRSKTGTVSDPLRILGAAAKVRAARLPHEELARLAGTLRQLRKESAPGGGAMIYVGKLDAAGARKLAPTAYRAVARSGQATIWVGADRLVHKYTLTLRLQGRLGNAEIDGNSTKSVTLEDRGRATVAPPEAARKALE